MPEIGENGEESRKWLTDENAQEGKGRSIYTKENISELAKTPLIGSRSREELRIDWSHPVVVRYNETKPEEIIIFPATYFTKSIRSEYPLGTEGVHHSPNSGIVDDTH